jgi:nicotinamide-nucleotide amidase
MSADVRALHEELARRSATVATAESLTAGLLAAALTDPAGASRTFRGGVVAYATDLKTQLLGVAADVIASHGVASPAVATAMAEGVRERLSTTYGVSLTGVAGPDAQDGCAPGTVFVAVAGPTGTEVRRLDLSGDRSAVRAGSVDGAVALLKDVLAAGGGRVR